MKIVKLIRPALDPQRHLELQVREAQAGLADFVQAMAPPDYGWLQVELLPQQPASESPVTQRSRRTG